MTVTVNERLHCFYISAENFDVRHYVKYLQPVAPGER